MGTIAAGLILLGSSGCPLFAVADYARRYQAAIDALPSTTVRGINRTDVAARVTFDAGFTAPEEPFFPFIPDLGGEPYLSSADYQSVVVAPGGTVNGTLKCGEVIAVSAGTLVVEIDTPGTLGTFDPQTGTTTALTMGTGTVRIE